MDSIEDSRKRFYVPVKSILWKSDNVADEACRHLVGNVNIQNTVPQNKNLCLLPPGGAVLLDFGKELHGGIRIVSAVNHGKSSNIRIRFGESAGEAMGAPDNDHAMHDTTLTIPSYGMAEYGNTAFRFIRIDYDTQASQDLELVCIAAVAIYRDLEYAGDFSCNDERLNQIWEVGAYTVHLNMQDYLYDGAKRDRMVWAGDLYPELKVIGTVFNETEIIERSLEIVAENNSGSDWLNGVSSYSAWWIICQHDYFMLRGNLNFLKKNKSKINTVLNKLMNCIGTNGEEKLDGIRFLDWPTSNDEQVKHAGLQGLMGWTFLCGEHISVYLSDQAMAKKCSRARKLLSKYVPNCMNNKTAAAMQVLGGLIDPVKSNQEIFAVNPNSNISTFFGYFILQARAAAGDIAGSLHLISEFWGAMIDYGATTFWEDFDLNWTKNSTGIDELPVVGRTDIHADFGNYCYKGLRHSLCHGWAGGPTAFLSEKILGVTPVSPGFKQIAFKPCLGDLKWASGEIPTPYGAIAVNLEIDRKGKMRSSIKPPAEIELTVDR